MPTDVVVSRWSVMCMFAARDEIPTVSIITPVKAIEGIRSITAYAAQYTMTTDDRTGDDIDNLSFGELASLWSCDFLT
jgi:hypothetical protein